MRGIYFKEAVLHIFFYLLFLTGIINILLPVFEKENTESQNEARESISNESKLKNIIQFLIMISVIVSIFYLSIWYEIRLIMIPFLAVGFLYLGIVFIGVLIDFIRSIFINPFNFKTSKFFENSLWLVGLLTFMTFNKLADENTICIIRLHTANWNAFILDFLKMSFLILWYFFLMFFSLVFLLLTLHNIIAFCNKKKENVKCKEWKYNELEIIFNSEKVWGKLKKSQNYKKKILYGIIWILYCIWDSLKALIIAIIEMVRKIILAMAYVLLRSIEKVINLLKKDQSKVVIISSRISLISSLLIVYLIDKYEQVFSKSGSEVYGFLCSAIIIPFLISQISSLRKDH